MPGYADWEQLYEKELFQLKEEGYDVSGAHVYTDAEISYHELWKIHGTELRRIIHIPNRMNMTDH